MEVFLFVKLQPSFFSIMHASVNSQLLISVPIFPPCHFQATAWLLMARLLCKSLPHSLYHSLECWRGEHVFLRCPFLSLMQTLCSPTVLVSAGAKEWETCLYVLSNQYLCLSSSAQACCILIKVPDALGWGLPSGWPSLVQQDSYVTAPGGASWSPGAAVVPRAVHAWRMKRGLPHLLACGMSLDSSYLNFSINGKSSFHWKCLVWKGLQSSLAICYVSLVENVPASTSLCPFMPLRQARLPKWMVPVPLCEG